ncbi:MAG: hypothetical protein U1D97_06180 [Desulfuromonadales bacterium]|nr:hypothetical protein [Desulfuromonadales bacterium]
MTEPKEASASKLWCEECQGSDYVTKEDKYLCASCGKVLNADREVHHEIFPHVSGDTDKMH